MMRLLLVRHGQTDYNLDGRYCGFSDPPLNVSGVSQAGGLSGQFKDLDVTAVYSSHLLRSVQTAEIIFSRYQVRIMRDFREINFGIFEGLNYGEITKKYPGIYRDWTNDPSNISFPEGENFGEFKERVGNALSSIISSHGNETIALVTHGGPIRLILCEALGYGVERFWDEGHENAEFGVIDYPEGCPPMIVKTDQFSRLLSRNIGT